MPQGGAPRAPVGSGMLRPVVPRDAQPLTLPPAAPPAALRPRSEAAIKVTPGYQQYLAVLNGTGKYTPWVQPRVAPAPLMLWHP